MTYQFEDCVLDTARYELRRNGTVVPIEPQVFDLLCFLIEQRQRTVSKDDLIDAVWRGRIVSESALTSRIKAARRAVGDDGQRQGVIRTIHGRGVRFVADVRESAPAEADPVVAPSDADAAGAGEDDKPTLAVLPFDNLGPDADDAYFCDAITDEITLLMARHRWLQVISRHSSFSFRGQQRDARDIGRALGARYLVEGSVRRKDSQLRLGVQLVRARDGAQIFAERYDREIDNVFALQEDVAQSIAATLEPELASAEFALTRAKRPQNLSAWECFQRGRWHLFTFSEQGLAEAERLFARALAIDPTLPQANAGLAYVYIQQAFYGPPGNRPIVLEAAMASARRAIQADAGDAYSHFVLGRVHSLCRNHDEALAELQVALELNPSFCQAHLAIGFTLTSSRRPAEAIDHFMRFSRFSPRDPHLWTNYHMHGLSRFWLGELDRAEDLMRGALRQYNVTRWPYASLVAVLGAAGKRESAKTAAAALLEVVPDYTRETARDDFFFMDDPEHLELYLHGLKQAGIP